MSLGVSLLKLAFKSQVVGGGEFTLQVTVNHTQDPRILNGAAEGEFLLGTQFSPKFTAQVEGFERDTGFGETTKVGELLGKAFVSKQDGSLDGHLEPFTASYAVDNHYSGKGSFTIGEHTYEDCVVNLID